MRRQLAAALVAIAALGAPLPVMAQGYYQDDQYDRPPPPRPRPPPPDDYGFRPPPPPDEYGRPPPPPFTRYGGPLVCRTEEGSCRAGRGPRFFRARCYCDFGDGPVSGRLKP